MQHGSVFVDGHLKDFAVLLFESHIQTDEKKIIAHESIINRLYLY